MKIGFNEASAMKKSNLVNDLALAQKYGYDYIEIRLDMLQDYLAAHSVKDLASFFSNSYVKPYALNAIEEINYNHDVNALKDQVERACEVAKAINNPYLIVVPSFRNEIIKTKSESEIEKESIDVLNQLADIAEQFDVKLAFEPVGFESCAVRNIKCAWNIVRKVDRKSIGLVIDAFNIYIYNRLKDIKDLDEVDFNKVFVFHINDCEGDIPLENIELKHRVWPGDGVIPLDKLLHTFYRKGFDKIASIELFREDYWELDPELVFKKSLSKTKEQLSLYYK